jgi:hypothetical protein
LEVNSKILGAVKQLGGVYKQNLAKDTQYLLVGKVGSDKHAMVLDQSNEWTRNVQCLRAEWIFACVGKDALVDPSDYQVLPFTGLTLSVTQIHATDAEERKALEMRLVENGARFSANLVKKVCTHLIAKEPNGNKYKQGLKWGMHICTEGWVDECIRKGTWVSEQDFPVVVAAPPAIHEQEGYVKATSGSAKAHAKTKEAADAAAGVEDSRQRSRQAEDPSDAERLAKLCKPETVPESELLAMDTFFVGGFLSAHYDVVMQLIIKGGGRLQPILTDKVTKVVLGELCTEELADAVRHLMSSTILEVVTIEWLAQTVSLEEPQTTLPEGSEGGIYEGQRASFIPSSSSVSSTTATTSEAKATAKKVKFPAVGKRKARRSLPPTAGTDTGIGMASRIQQRNKERNVPVQQDESQFVSWGNITSP